MVRVLSGVRMYLSFLRMAKNTSLLVDICITTPLKELEQVCILADFLAKSMLQSPPTKQAPVS